MKNIQKKQKGFTLIELLVVIGIIGILSGIVLINVNSARNKAKDAAIKKSVEQVRIVAEFYYLDNGYYEGLLLDFTGSEGYLKLRAGVAAKGGVLLSHTANDKYCTYSSLNTGGYWCVDSTGRSSYYVDPTAKCLGITYSCE